MGFTRTPTTDATSELIARFAATGRDDPTIAARLGISASQVRRLRQEYDIPPGETRWLGHDNPLNTRSRQTEQALNFPRRTEMPMDVKVGDEVIVVEGRRNGGSKRRATVTKVARVYFTATYAGSSRDDQFRLDNGRLKGNDIGWGVYAKTPEQIDQEERRVAAKEALRARGVEFRLGFHAAYTVEQMEALVALVETFDESKED